jgi:lipopolysaccharide export system permease protein
MALVGFVALFQLVNLFDRIDLFIDNHAAVTTVMRFYLYDMPSIVVLVLPMALLLAALLSLGHSVRTNELLAVRAAGQSMSRTVAPLVLLSAVLAVSSFALGETVIPWSVVRRDHIMSADVRHEIPREPEVHAGVVHLGHGGRIWLAQIVDERDSSLTGLAVEEMRGGRLTWRVDARRARFRGGRWILEDGVERRFRDTSEGARENPHASVRAGAETATRFTERIFPDLTESPTELSQVERQPTQMGAFSLRSYVERLKETGGKVQRYLTEFHVRIAWPVANVIIVLIGVALSTRLRRGGVALGAGLALLISFSYYGVLKTGQALGYNGNLPPVMAAWMGNAVFALIAAALVARMER